MVIKKVILVLAILASLYLAKGFFIAAVVNGDPISRYAVIRELEREQGKAALDWLVTKSLILQEARRRKVGVSPKEVEEEYGKMSKSMVAQGQTLDQVLVLQGISKANFKDRIRVSKLIEKMFKKEIVVTDKEVEEFLEKNKESVPENTDPAKLKASARQQLESQKIDQKGNELVAKLKKQAKVYYFVKY